MTRPWMYRFSENWNDSRGAHWSTINLRLLPPPAPGWQHQTCRGWTEAHWLLLPRTLLESSNSVNLALSACTLGLYLLGVVRQGSSTVLVWEQRPRLLQATTQLLPSYPQLHRLIVKWPSTSSVLPMHWVDSPFISPSSLFFSPPCVLQYLYRHLNSAHATHPEQDVRARHPRSLNWSDSMLAVVLTASSAIVHFVRRNPCELTTVVCRKKVSGCASSRLIEFPACYGFSANQAFVAGSTES